MKQLYRGVFEELWMREFVRVLFEGSMLFHRRFQRCEAAVVEGGPGFVVKFSFSRQFVGKFRLRPAVLSGFSGGGELAHETVPTPGDASGR
jgi:hypothetical protein